VALLDALAAVDPVALAAPPHLTVAEWADRYRVLSREASAEPGKYRTDRAPYQRGILEACSDPLIDEVVVVSASQVGKTEIELNVIGFYIDQDPAPIMVVVPSVDPDAKAWSTDRIAPMLRDTPRLQGKVRDARTRDSGNKILHKTFPGGHITLVGANSPSGLASRPIRVLLFDEIDRFAPSAGAEGDPVSLATKRTSTFWNRKVIKVSSPTIKGISRIERDWQRSDQRYFETPCPSCGHFQRLIWKQLVWDTGAPDTARYACAACGVLLEEADKLRMLLGGRWTPTRPSAHVAGFHLSALYSPWTRWAELAREFLEAKDNAALLQPFVNARLGEWWEEPGEQFDVTGLAARREAYTAVPASVGVLTAGVDLQADRLELAVYGWAPGEEAWTLAHERIYGDPEQDDVWQRLETLLVQPYPREGGGELRIRACAIDSGAFTHAVYRFVRPRQGRGVVAVKGVSQRGRPLLGKPAKRNRHGVRVWPIGTDTAKDVLFARLRLQVPGPGYLHFPRAGASGLDDEYLAQFGAEKVVARYVRGMRVREYHTLRERNEAIDLYVYAFAALYTLGSGVVDHLAEIAASHRPPARPGAPGEPSPAAPIVAPKGPRRGSSWVNRWR
jgi:phage terminase large subunit GpA-like protein